MKVLINTVTILIVILSVLSCTGSKTIELNYRGKTLIYNCSKYVPQAETRSDIKILFANIRKVIDGLKLKQRLVTLQALSRSRTRDIRTTERIIVGYYCEEKYGIRI